MGLIWSDSLAGTPDFKLGFRVFFVSNLDGPNRPPSPTTFDPNTDATRSPRASIPRPRDQRRTCPLLIRTSCRLLIHKTPHNWVDVQFNWVGLFIKRLHDVYSHIDGYDPQGGEVRISTRVELSVCASLSAARYLLSRLELLICS